MEKKTVSAKEVLADIHGGLTDTELMCKYGLSEKGLHSLRGKLVTAGLLNHPEPQASSNSFDARNPGKLSVKEVMSDIRSGMSNDELMGKHGISSQALHGLLRKLLNAGFIQQAEVDQRVSALMGQASNAWKCPSCGMPQASHFDECPQCGILVDKYLEKKRQAEASRIVAPGEPPVAEEDQQTETPEKARASLKDLGVLAGTAISKVDLDSGVKLARGLFGSLKEKAKRATNGLTQKNEGDNPTEPTPAGEDIRESATGSGGGLIGSLKNKAREGLARASMTKSCSICGTKLTLMEIGTKKGICAKCDFKQSGLLQDPTESIEFSQAASYREGLPDYPQEAKKHGFIYVCQNHLYFRDAIITSGIAWKQVKDAQLENFKMSGTRAVLAGYNAIMLQNVKNYLAVNYFDDQQMEWTIKFQIHGALSIPGEQEKAVELLGYINKFRPRFWKEQKTTSVAETPGISAEDIPGKIEKLGKLKEQGLITQEEFEEKKKELLARL